MTSLYVDPDRKSGSQSETPSFWHEGKYICFDGYQRFRLAQDSIRFGNIWHHRKYALIRPFLLGPTMSGRSIIDLGCSAGVMGFQAYLDGFHQVCFVDHDAEYLQLVRAGLNHLGATEAVIEENKLQDLSATSDILFAFAIIHWLYSCTEEYGSLDRIVEKLSEHCKHAMFIEWIGPECKDVRSFGHILRNPEVHQEPYTRANFIGALRNRFPFVKRVGRVRKGREIWLASHYSCSADPRIRILETTKYWVAASFAVLKRLTGK